MQVPKSFPVPEEKTELWPVAQHPAPILPPELKQELCQALFDYTPELPDELPLQRGDVIRILSKRTEAEGWWHGQCRHRRGLFPNNFVELLPVPTLRPAMPPQDGEPERSRFPLASRAPCGAGAAWHGTARHGLVGSPTRTAKDEEKVGEKREQLELPAPARMEPAKIPPSKRMAPAPPVPAKAKPTSKPSVPQPCTPADMEWGRAGDPDPDGFNAVPVTTAKLSHPTAARPRVPGQRPPSLALGCTGDPWGLPSTGQVPGSPRGTEMPVAPRPEEKLALEDLKAEVRTLHILVDLMRVQHLRDLEDLRLEVTQERAKCQVLQAEIERVRKVLPC